MVEKAERFLRLPEVLNRTGLKRTTVQNLTKAGQFPRPVRLSNRAKGWPESEVVQWIQDTIRVRRIIKDGDE